MDRRPIALGAVILAGSACETTALPSSDSWSGAQVLQAKRNAGDEPRCGTLRDVTSGDLVAVDGDLIYYLDETEGLGIVDVEDVDRPKTLARVPFTGTPLALYLRGATDGVAAGTAGRLFVIGGGRIQSREPVPSTELEVR